MTPASASEHPSPSQRLAARWPIAAAALAIVFAVLVVAYFGGALIRETAGTPASSSFVAASPTAGVPSGSAVASADVAFPSAAETALLGLLPEHDRDRCQRADPEDRPIAALFRVPGQTPERYLTSVEAGIECDLGGISAPDRLWLWQVVRTGLDNARAALAAHAGIAGAAPGICREERPAVEDWSFGGTSGRLVCYESTTGDAVLLWVFDGSQLFARVLRDDQDVDALLDWWEDVGRFSAP